ncbi:MAG: aldo/keto reductase [Candidatus Poribacteria bacterium]
MQIITLRRTGIKLSRLGFGTGTHGWGGSSEQTRIGHHKLVSLLKLAYSYGITFWESAEAYGSHPHIADALKGIDRSTVTILTKIFSRDGNYIRDIIPKFLKLFDTDYIDILLMHCISEADWLKRYTDAIDALKKAKDEGLVRGIGISCHNFGALKTVPSADWIDVVLARINYNDTNMDAKTSDVVPVLKEIHDSGKDVLAMKVIGQGKLNDDVRKCFKFVMGLPYVDAMTVGMTSEEQLMENIALVDEFTSI